MDNSLSFFRVFDLAFFAPGTLLFGVMWRSGYFSDVFSSHGDTVHGILTGAFAVMLIYVLGLICHGIQRAVFRLITLKDKESPPWYTKLKKDNPSCNELAMYFWYLRATCWNLVVAIILGLLTSHFQKPLSPLIVLVSAIVIGVLWFLGCEYDKSLKETIS